MPLSILCIVITLSILCWRCPCAKTVFNISQLSRRFLSLHIFHKNYYLSLDLIAILWKFFMKNILPQSPNVELFDDSHNGFSIASSSTTIIKCIQFCISHFNPFYHNYCDSFFLISIVAKMSNNQAWIWEINIVCAICGCL
jgi:hypothetical protein